MVCTLRAMQHPCDCDIEESASCIGEEVVEFRRTSRDERLVIFVQQAVHHAENESTQEGTISQHQEIILVVEGASCQPAKNEVDHSMDNFVRARRERELEVGIRNSGKKVDNDHP